jgi:hypothetical protein
MPGTRQLVTVLALTALTCLPSLGNDAEQGAYPSQQGDQDRSARALQEQFNEGAFETPYYRAVYHLRGCVLEVKRLAAAPCPDPEEERLRSTTDFIDFTEMQPNVEIDSAPNRPGQDSVYFYLKNEIEKYSTIYADIPDSQDVQKFLDENGVASRRISKVCGEVIVRAPGLLSSAPIRTGNHAELESSIESYIKAYCSSE